MQTKRFQEKEMNTALSPTENHSTSFNPKSSNCVWTSENIVKSPLKNLVIPNKSIPEHVWKNLDMWADKTAIVCGVTGYSYTYRQLYKHSNKFGANLRSRLQIRDNDVVCIMIPNCPDYAVMVLGILQAGAVVTAMNPLYTAHELKGLFSLANPKLIISTPERIEVIQKGLSLANIDIPIMLSKIYDENLPTGTISFEEFFLGSKTDNDVSNVVITNNENVALLLYSSGTTGLPKGVVLTHQNIVANCIQQDADGFKLYADTTSFNQDSVLATPPFYHIYGLSIIMIHKLSVGMKIVTLPNFHPSTFIPTLSDHKITMICATPPTVLFLAYYPNLRSQHLKSIKTITCGAAPLPKGDIIKVFEKIKHKINFIQIYGLTETSPVATSMLAGSDNYSTVGFAVPNTELRVVDSYLRNLGPNETGEILIRGPQVMKGYRNNEEATKVAFVENGWLKTGDVGRIDEDGVVTIVDRLKDMIKVKSYQVSPAELESVLKEHPDIIDAAVIGVPDERFGEVPKAFIVVKDRRYVETHKISNFVADRVVEYKRIKEIIVLDNLPKSPSGKVLKMVLKDKFGKIDSL